VYFDKVACDVTPEVSYSSSEVGNLSISFTVSWVNVKSGQKNLLVLIDDYQKMSDYYKRNWKYVFLPAASDAKKNHNISILNNGIAIPYHKFKQGFMSIEHEAPKPIVISNSNLKDGLLEVKFRFAYMVGAGTKRTLKTIADDFIYWKLKIPTAYGKEIGCDGLEDIYSRKINQLPGSIDTKQAAELRSDIGQDARFVKCPDLKKDLLFEIEKYIKSEEDNNEVATVEKEVKSEPKSKAKVNKKPASIEPKVNWADLEKKYKASINKLNNDYSKLKSDLTNSNNSINSSIVESESSIFALSKEYSIDMELEAHEKKLLKNKYSELVSTNNKNRKRTNSSLEKLKSFWSKVNRERSHCKNEHTSIDESEGLQKFKKFEKSFSSLIENTNALIKQTKAIQGDIEINKDEILELAMIAADEEDREQIKEISSSFDTIYEVYRDEIVFLNSEYAALKDEFENKRYSRWYFPKSKNGFLNQTAVIFNQLTELQNKDSITKEDKEYAAFELNIPNSSTVAEKEFDEYLFELKSKIELLRNEIEEARTENFPYLYLVLFLVVIAILGFGGRIYYKALKEKAKKSKSFKSTVTTTDTEKTSSSGGITITQNLNVQPKGKGLLEVRQNTNADFLELDLGLEWEDTMVKKIYFDRECIIKTYRFFEDSIRETETGSTANETGGYLIGRWDTNTEDPDKFDVSLEDFVEPGDDATFSSHQLNFGAKIGVKLQKTIENWKQKTNKEMVMTAWFHSHPGLKIFLSDFDLSVQKDFSGADKKLRMIALVIDPYTEKWETGIFTYKSDLSMNNAVDSKQFFSLDEMYRWALNSDDTDHENHYSELLSSIFSDTTINKLYFSNSCILEIKRKIEDDINKLNENDILVFLGGNKLNIRSGTFDFLIEELLVKEDIEVKSNQFFGCVVRVSNEFNDITEILSKAEFANNDIQIILAYNPEDNSILPISRNLAGEFNSVPESSAKFSFNELINWTRKRN